MGHRPTVGLGVLAPYLPMAGLLGKTQTRKSSKDRQVLVLIRILCRPRSLLVDLAVVPNCAGTSMSQEPVLFY